MAPAVATAAEQAENLRQLGKTFFAKSKFGAAVDAYTEAITLCPKVAVYWTNRALCFRKRDDWTKVEEDCRKALELDSSSVKAHYMLGLALLQRQEYSEGVKQLERAWDLGRGANRKSYIVEEIWQELAKAKYLEWQEASGRREQKLRALREVCESAIIEKNLCKLSQMGDGFDEAANPHMEELESLEEVFMKAAEADTPTEVPDYLCCKLTLDVFRDPVITPSGITYERAEIIHHLEKVGKFDPVTRDPLDQHQLIPNLAIKEAVQAYLNKHGWAYNMK